MADELVVQDEYRAQTWAMLIRECKASGMTNRDFCEQRGISNMTESQAFAAVMTFIVVLITCLADGIASLIPPTAKAAWITYSVIWVLFSVWLWRAMKNATLAVLVFSLGEAALSVVYLLKGEIFEGTVAKVLGTLSVMSVYNNTISGVFELRMPVYYLSIAFVFCFLTYQNIRKRRYS